ncbi:uncharacterized protein K489DRAFT_49306 [Dissoconium aciculare CBS 342.82]|uniref:Uncharacterized protein n=1 Tax=Dissoconium aciculare CBS 342.82 TaxID=1314786 RepID=A0A6J3LWR7_9PEZI|nr:uncharacterized protein K489DRAFT_49306 [Dissoconium aciculare CBS 342.82]KAF1820205.1 hypothetical protein K489DRAFT_49306 [Dissoconium aciculare CBS 342.82]
MMIHDNLLDTFAQQQSWRVAMEQPVVGIGFISRVGALLSAVIIPRSDSTPGLFIVTRAEGHHAFPSCLLMRLFLLVLLLLCSLLPASAAGNAELLVL